MNYKPSILMKKNIHTSEFHKKKKFREVFRKISQLFKTIYQAELQTLRQY